MYTDSLESRIARQVTLRRLEVTSITATVLAFGLTVTLIGGTPLQESNLVAVELVERLGWTGAGVLAVITEAGIFAGYRRQRPQFPRSATAGGIFVASIGVGDLLFNVRALLNVGLPETVAWWVVLEPAVAVGTVGSVLICRGWIGKTFDKLLDFSIEKPRKAP